MSTVSQTGIEQIARGRETSQADKADQAKYGKTIGEPQLSEKAQKYYQQLKMKYSNMDFILVSEDEKENAQAQAGRYANANRTVVLIDEAKIERMAEDEQYRKQYENIISGATSQLKKLAERMQSSLGANAGSIKGYGIQVKNGLASLFAVVDKAQTAQKARIEKKTAERRAERKEAKKAAEKKRTEKREENRKADKDKLAEMLSGEDTVTVTASTVEDLLRQIEDALFDARTSSVRTEEEKQVGTHIDFWG